MRLPFYALRWTQYPYLVLILGGFTTATIILYSCLFWKGSFFLLYLLFFRMIQPISASSCFFHLFYSGQCFQYLITIVVTISYYFFLLQTWFNISLPTLDNVKGRFIQAFFLWRLGFMQRWPSNGIGLCLQWEGKTWRTGTVEILGNFDCPFVLNSTATILFFLLHFLLVQDAEGSLNEVDSTVVVGMSLISCVFLEIPELEHTCLLLVPLKK